MPDDVSTDVYIVDTSLLIDCYRGKLLAQLFALPFRLITSNLIAVELQEPPLVDVLSLGLEVYEMTVEQLLEIQRLQADHRKLSINDLSAFILTRDLDGILLSRDRRLQDLATSHNLIVRDTFWVFDEMLRHAIVTIPQILDSFRVMREQQNYLPSQDYEATLRERMRNQKDNS